MSWPVLLSVSGEYRTLGRIVMKKTVPVFIALSLLAAPPAAFAVCPVCTVAVVAGLGLSRWLGVDDTVSGVWIGGFILSSGLWLAAWLKRKSVRVPFLSVWSVLLMYATVVIPLVASHVIGHPRNTLFGIDKLVFGGTAGSALFLAGMFLDRILRVTNGGRVRFYYQKVVCPVVLLIVGSLAFFIATKR
jgi:hypothetical protein